MTGDNSMVLMDESVYSLVEFAPNKLLIATGQATGHDRREGRVSCAFPDIYFKGIFLQQFF